VDLAMTTTHPDDEHTVVAVAGDVDLFSAPALRAHFTALVDAGHRHLAVDLDGVHFLDSVGIGAFVAVLKNVRSHDGSLRLVCTNERVCRLFRMTVPRDLPMFRSLAEAYADEAGSAAPLR
jgi:anti-sigma B factor antagonist